MLTISKLVLQFSIHCTKQVLARAILRVCPAIPGPYVNCTGFCKTKYDRSLNNNVMSLMDSNNIVKRIIFFSQSLSGAFNIECQKCPINLIRRNDYVLVIEKEILDIAPL
jgi:hypothetical protein